MNKSAIYATVKTSNLVVGIAMGMVVVHIHKIHGWSWSVPSFLVTIILSWAYGQFGNWVFRKFNIKD